MKWIGLTGGIATGKSTVAGLIAGYGVPVIDADKISHDLTRVGLPAYQKIVSHFGTKILNQDSTINRKKLGQKVFSDPRLKSELEAILHPLIKEEVQKLKNQFSNLGHKLCFYDVPLLFEKNLQENFDLNVLVWCNKQTQLDRLMSRSGLSQEESLLRIQNQLPLIDKVNLADYCIDNSGDLEDLEKQIKNFIKKLSSELRD